MAKSSTSFKPGASGNPAGKPAGTTTPLSRIKNVILDVFQKHEFEFQKELDTLAATRPIDYYNGLVAPFMPKELKVDADLTHKNGDRVVKNQEAFRAIDELEQKLKQKTKNSASSAKK